MKLTRVLLFYFFFLSITSSAKNKGDYYFMDSTLFTEVDLVDHGDRENCRFCHEKTMNTIIKLTPNQVREYLMDGDKFYVSMNLIQGDTSSRVFLEKKVIGGYTLYHYANAHYDRFFLQKGVEPMVELLERQKSGLNFRKQLAECTKDNPTVSAKSAVVDFSKSSITYFLESYELGRMKPFPKGTWGLSIGMNRTAVELFAGYTDPDLLIFDFKNDDGICMGFFLVQPLFQNGFSIHVNGTYANSHFEAYKTVVHSTGAINLATDYHYNSNLQTIELPIHLRYTLPAGSIRPFIEVGGLVAWNFTNDVKIYRSLTRNGVQTNFGYVSPTVFDTFYSAPSLGLGFEIPVKKSQSLFLECHLTRSQGLLNPELGKLTRLVLSTGYSF